MVTHHIGSLIVLDDQGQVIGIITERDILRECTARSEQVKTILVQQVMTKDLIISVPADEVGCVMGVMTQNRIRHLPILDGGRLKGLISIGDVVKAQLEATESENRYLREYIQQ
jgi:CBS domain-containing protein